MNRLKSFIIAISIFSIIAAFGYGIFLNKSLTNTDISTNAAYNAVADLNSDSTVNGSDLSILLSNWGTPTKADINKDGTVGASDLSILLSGWGNSAVEQAIWQENFESGTLSNFVNTDTHNMQPGSYNGAPQPWSTRSVVASNSVNPNGGGNYIGKYYVPAGPFTYPPRSESTIGSVYNFSKGQDKWFSFRVMLGSDMPDASSYWQVITQWKNDGYGSPPISISINNGDFRLDGGYGYPGSTTDSNYVIQNRQYSQVISPATKNVWHKFKIHICFDDDPTKGYIELWHNDQQISWNPYVESPYPKVISGTKFYPPAGTLYPNLQSYLKIGLYRNSLFTTSGTVYFDDYKMGNSGLSVN